MRTHLIRFSLLVLLGLNIAASWAAGPRAVLPFAPADFSGVWHALSCLNESELASGTYELHIASSRKVTGAFYDDLGATVAQVKGTVSRSGLVRARLVRRGSLTGIVVGTTNLNVQGFFSGKCAGTFGPVPEPTTTNVIVITNIIIVTNLQPLFPDPNLLVAVGNRLGKPGEQLTTQDLQALTTFSSYDDNIRNLTGLQYATQLYAVDLDRNPVTNYTALYSLPDLQILTLGSGIRDVSFITNLTDLYTVSARNNLFRDASPFGALSNLFRLDLDSTPVTNVSVLGTNPSLRDLNVSRCGIQSLAGFEALTNLSFLSLYENGFRDVSPLAGLTNLRSLGLSAALLTNAETLHGLTALMALGLTPGHLGNISWMASLTNLESLSVGGNEITDISSLSGLGRMSDLYLSDNPIADFTPLGGLTNLRTLWVQGSGLNDASFVGGLFRLQSFYGRSNQICDVQPFAHATNLYSLTLGENCITNLASLSSLHRLGNLTVDQNQLSDLSGTEGMAGLLFLDARDNQITNIASITSLTGLQNVYLSDNLLTDISPLAALTNLSSVYLHNNRLDLRPGSTAATVIQTLQSRGVFVASVPQKE